MNTESLNGILLQAMDENRLFTHEPAHVRLMAAEILASAVRSHYVPTKGDGSANLRPAPDKNAPQTASSCPSGYSSHLEKMGKMLFSSQPSDEGIKKSLEGVGNVSSSKMRMVEPEGLEAKFKERVKEFIPYWGTYPESYDQLATSLLALAHDFYQAQVLERLSEPVSLEAGARAVCASMGIDPDSCSRIGMGSSWDNGIPKWKDCMREAKACAEAWGLPYVD